MNIIQLKKAMIGIGVTLLLGACGSDNNRSVQVPPPPPPPPPPPMAVDFTPFVKAQFDATADDTDPVAVDDTDFAFNDEDNPGAFDDLLATP